MTQEQIDSIRKRMCNFLCVVPVSGFIPEAAKQICSNCPLNELEESAEPKWIPVTERLPEEDKEVLITYKEKGDELDKPYSNIDITTYGQMYFGGNKVGNHKHWRSPFQYFYDNYEVTAWMPLPEPYEPGVSK